MEAESMFFNHLKNTIQPVKSIKYLEYLKSKFPDRELHHILGSYTGMKGTDFLIYPCTHKEHEHAEKNKSQFGIEVISSSINLLIEYAKGKE